jgi:hypothetical protein
MPDKKFSLTQTLAGLFVSEKRPDFFQFPVAASLEDANAFSTGLISIAI